MNIYAYEIISLTAFAVNIPLGALRERTLKFSLPWFFWIHTSIPLIIYLRITLGTSKLFIPVCILLAIAGQITGGRLARRFITDVEREKLLQIPDIRISGRELTPLKGKTAVVLLNMGGPASLNGVAPFLIRLFSDPELIRFPGGALFQPLMARLIVFFRAAAARKRYALIGGASPIGASTEAQRKALADELARRGHSLPVIIAFNYSSPDSIEAARRIKEAGINQVLPLSLYPQYARATTGSSVMALEKALRLQECSASVLPVPEYEMHPGYISALVERIKAVLNCGERLEHFFILFSGHGLPLYNVVEGDTYPARVQATVALVLQNLERRSNWTLSWQSAAGPLCWIRPYTEDMIPALARRGVRKLIVVPISFVSDHIETLCEVDIEYRELAAEHGIKDFRMSKAVEAHPDFIRALADTVELALKG